MRRRSEQRMQGKCSKDWSAGRAGEDKKDVAFRVN